MRPTFLRTASQRKALCDLSGLEDAMQIVEEYSQDFEGVFEWTFSSAAMSDAVPPGYINQCLFWTGTLGLTKIDGALVLVPGTRFMNDVYGQPKEWYATHLYGNYYQDYGKKLKVDKNPIIDIGMVPAMQILEYCKVQSTALISAGQNADGMRQPFIIGGARGDLTAHMVKMAIKGGESVFTQLKDSGNGFTENIEVLQTGVQNFVDPLINLIDASDAWIAPLICVDVIGTQKASGITVEEAVSTQKRVDARRKSLLAKLKRFCDDVNNLYPDIGISVGISDTYAERLPTVSPDAGGASTVSADAVPRTTEE